MNLRPRNWCECRANIEIDYLLLEVPYSLYFFECWHDLCTKLWPQKMFQVCGGSYFLSDFRARYKTCESTSLCTLIILKVSIYIISYKLEVVFWTAVFDYSARTSFSILTEAVHDCFKQCFNVSIRLHSITHFIISCWLTVNSLRWYDQQQQQPTSCHGDL